MKTAAIDVELFTRKYRVNVPGLIRAWKKGVSDAELASHTGIDITTLSQIKYDLEIAHRRARMAKKPVGMGKDKPSVKHHIFFNPFT